MCKIGNIHSGFLHVVGCQLELLPLTGLVLESSVLGKCNLALRLVRVGEVSPCSGCGRVFEDGDALYGFNLSSRYLITVEPKPAVYCKRCLQKEGVIW